MIFVTKAIGPMNWSDAAAVAAVKDKLEKETVEDDIYCHIDPYSITYSGWKVHIYGENVGDVIDAMKRIGNYLERNNLFYKMGTNIRFSPSTSAAQRVKAITVYIPDAGVFKRIAHDLLGMLQGYPVDGPMRGDKKLGPGMYYRYEFTRPVSHPVDFPTYKSLYTSAGSGYNMPGNSDPLTAAAPPQPQGVQPKAQIPAQRTGDMAKKAAPSDITCPRCGTNFSVDVKRCPACGAPRSEMAIPMGPPKIVIKPPADMRQGGGKSCPYGDGVLLYNGRDTYCSVSNTMHRWPGKTPAQVRKDVKRTAGPPTGDETAAFFRGTERPLERAARRSTFSPGDMTRIIRAHVFRAIAKRSKKFIGLLTIPIIGIILSFTFLSFIGGLWVPFILLAIYNLLPGEQELPGKFMLDAVEKEIEILYKEYDIAERRHDESRMREIKDKIDALEEKREEASKELELE